MGPEYAHATFYRTDGSDEPLTMAQIGAIIAAGIGDQGQPGEYSFEEVEDTTYGLNEVPYERIFVALMLLQAELFQQALPVQHRRPGAEHLCPAGHRTAHHQLHRAVQDPLRSASARPAGGAPAVV